jgi:hypothetical protein
MESYLDATPLSLSVAYPEKTSPDRIQQAGIQISATVPQQNRAKTSKSKAPPRPHNLGAQGDHQNIDAGGELHPTAVHASAWDSYKTDRKVAIKQTLLLLVMS